MTQNESVMDGNKTVTGEQRLFDEHGRRIPPEMKSAAHRHTRRRFVCTQPAIDYTAIHQRITRHIGAAATLSAAEFERRAQAILEGLRSDARTRDITEGVHVPFYLPRAVSTDIGSDMESVYLKATQSAFREMFPDYAFVNHHAGGLSGALGIVPGSRHERLVDAMRQTDVVGYYFPCLLE